MKCKFRSELVRIFWIGIAGVLAAIIALDALLIGECIRDWWAQKSLNDGLLALFLAMCAHSLVGIFLRVARKIVRT